MADWRCKDPAQLKPGAASREVLYTVPAATETQGTGFTIVNTHATDVDLAEISIAPAGATHDDALHRIEIDRKVYPGRAFEITRPYHLAQNTEIRVESAGGNLIFHFHHSERSTNP
jgi:hypothetical protein